MGASWILRTGAAAVTAVAFTLLLASGGGAGSVREGGTLRVVEAGLFNTIDPALIRHIPEGIILRAACAGLVGLPHKPLPEGLRVVPELAEALPRISRDGKTYTFTIRKDARFSDGRPVTARHFLHALERIMNPAMSSSQVPYFERIAGAKAMLEGKATRLTGVVARGRTLTIRLTQPTPDFVLLLAGPGTTLCAVPATLPVDAEGAKAPLASPAPYYVSRFVPGERVVLQRNRFYRGPRPHHLDRIVGELGVGLGVFDRVLAGTADYALGPPSFFSQNASTLARRYGVNKTQFFVATAPGMRLFALNASRPLFKGNVKLRQAINFAVDRRALIRELGPYAGAATDQYLPPTMPGHIAARIYPVSPDLRKARALAAGNRRSGKAVLYTTDLPVDVAQAEILKQNLAKIGIELDIQKYPIPLIFEKLATPGEPFDIGRITWGGIVDPAFLSFLFDGTSIGTVGFGNWSYFDSPKFNRMLKRAERIPLGPERYRLYGEIDVQLARDAAPAVAYGVPNSLTLVSVNVGCVIVNPDLDLTAACLK